MGCIKIGLHRRSQRTSSQVIRWRLLPQTIKLNLESVKMRAFLTLVKILFVIFKMTHMILK